jgi:hypothetical protein
MTHEPFDDNVSPRTESDPDRTGTSDAARHESGATSEIDRYNRNLCIPAPQGIFVDPQLTIDPQPIRRLTELGPRLESKFIRTKNETESVLPSRDSPPTLGIDDFCC